jgi:hypothetical protein
MARGQSLRPLRARLRKPIQSLVTITIPLACVCGDFFDSHSQPRMRSDGSLQEPIATPRGGICWGWCDQTCAEFRPVLIDRTSHAWEAVIAQANELNLPHHFACDLYRDWQCLTADDAPEVFIWSAYESGTDLLYGNDVLTSFCAIPRTASDRRWFVWDGLSLRSVDRDDVHRRFCDANASRAISA